MIMLGGDDRWKVILSTSLALEYEAVIKREGERLGYRTRLLEQYLNYIFRRSSFGKFISAGDLNSKISPMNMFWSWRLPVLLMSSSRSISVISRDASDSEFVR